MNITFAPGPSELFYTVPNHTRNAFSEGIPSISHRSKTFEGIFHKATQGLKELLGVPTDYSIFFTGSATEIWEKSIQNLVEDSSTHLVNGSFSKRYFEIANQLGKKPIKIEVPIGNNFSSVSNLSFNLILPKLSSKAISQKVTAEM